MKPFVELHGRGVAMMAPNVDTDQILPKQFLRTVGRQGLGKALFYNLRFEESGTAKAKSIFNESGIAVLIAGENFGCGSSREHAAWALDDFGIRCVIAPSFAEIFSANCANNNILLIRLDPDTVGRLALETETGGSFSVDLASEVVTAPSGTKIEFKIDPRIRKKLLSGLDEIAETLSQESKIRSFEEDCATRTPWLSTRAMASTATNS
jgi:3-isopropylmalate/(R)-2-methylmalate dehydratase small subunit